MSFGWLRRLRRLRRGGAEVLMPLSGISRRERVTQEIDVPGANAFDTSEDGEPTARVEDERADCDLAMKTRLTGNRGEVPRDWPLARHVTGLVPAIHSTGSPRVGGGRKVVRERSESSAKGVGHFSSTP